MIKSDNKSKVTDKDEHGLGLAQLIANISTASQQQSLHSHHTFTNTKISLLPSASIFTFNLRLYHGSDISFTMEYFSFSFLLLKMPF